MATTIADLREHLAGPLGQVPSPVKLEYRRGQIIYGCHEPSTSIYLLVTGKVKLSRVAEDGRRVVVDIYQAGELFGESAFLNCSASDEEAVALENTKVLTWAAAEVADFAEQRPRIGLSLLQILARRTIELGDRIESFSSDSTARRLARTLIRLSERLGRVMEDGNIRMMPLTHELLSQFVGTSREIVTHCMNQFRREHCVNYSRKDGILVYRDALKEWLQHPPDSEADSQAT